MVRMLCGNVKAVRRLQHKTKPVNVRLQAAVRSSKGEDVTAFARIEDGSRTVSQGDVVRLNVKPAMMGMVLYFSVQQVPHHLHPSLSYLFAQFLQCIKVCQRFIPKQVGIVASSPE